MDLIIQNLTPGFPAFLRDSVYAIILSMILVVDTSVFISALLGPRGASRSILRHCLEGLHSPLMGTSLFLEYESVLHRPPLFKHCPLDPVEREELLDAFLSVCRWTTVYYRWRPNLPDDDDNHVIELAIAGGADCIVTNNTKDFTRTDLNFPNVTILKPEELLQRR